ncbi:hypothetical protein Pmani_009403 [Petrolisthes manimaculis]|uniref:Uncharacterized protein n=1 Tax=Petrolisthes manimaculis TaxID=1843537 RepID=A0AAE1Q495_9EUCA|nr:hypothetical protein Pmani_009403 [Petrolisthes manimaculis]
MAKLGGKKCPTSRPHVTLDSYHHKSQEQNEKRRREEWGVRVAWQRGEKERDVRTLPSSHPHQPTLEGRGYQMIRLEKLCRVSSLIISHQRGKTSSTHHS